MPVFSAKLWDRPDERERLYGKYRLADDEDEKSKVLKEIQRYNLNVSKYKGGVPKITRESLARTMKREARPEEMRMQRAMKKG